MTVTEIVQFRMPKGELELLRSKGLHPNLVAREQLHRYVRSLQMERSLKEIMDLSFRRNFDPVEAVREARDELDRRH